MPPISWAATVRMVSAIAAVLQLGAARPVRAQAIPGAVLAAREPHHHLAYEDSTIRVLRVRVPAHDTTLLHEHDADYFWIALGASEFVNARLGAPDAVAISADLAVHFAPGKFAHVARNTGVVPFDNITVELLEPQGTVRNLCEAAMAGQPLDCVESAERQGVKERPAFETDYLRVTLVSLGPGAVLRPVLPAASTWVIALDTVNVGHTLSIVGEGRWIGGTFRARDQAWAVENRGTGTVRVLTLASRAR